MSYDKLYSAIKARYAGSTGLFQQQKTNELWTELKKKYPKKKDLVIHTDETIQELKREVSERKASATLYFTQVLFLICSKVFKV